MAFRGRPLRERTATLRGRLILAVFALLVIATGFFVPFSIRVRALASRHAAGPSWRFPSRVYSDGVPFTPGRVLPRSYLLAELEARGYRRARIPLDRPGTYAFTSSGADIFLRGFVDGPDPEGTGGPESVRLFLQNNAVVRVDRLSALAGAPEPDLQHPPRLEPALISLMLDENRIRASYVTIDRIPPTVRDAVIAAEDRRFRGHAGIDARATTRALVSNLRSGGIREGGSTITQQLARGLFLGRQRTFARKLAEIPLALGLELMLSKEQILEMYLNMVYWGQAQGGGVAGIAEAARWYFDTPVEALRVEQAALLAGMIRAPNAIAPFEHPERALESRNAVLEDLVQVGKLDREEAARLKRLPLGLKRGAPPIERFPSYTGYVRESLERRLGRHATEAWGLSIFTTMDLAFQIIAEQELARGVARLDAWSGRRGPPLQGAFVALEPRTEVVRAIVGGRNPEIGDFNRATQARRQTGSAIKPIVYAAALANGGGASFTPATTVPDEPRTFGQGDDAWTPHNDAGRYHPSVTLAKALALSLNVATANLVEAIGPGLVAEYTERFGLGKLKPVLSIGLGTNETSLLELTGAFAVFAGEGRRRGPSPIRLVSDSRGRSLLTATANTEDVIPPGIAAVMTGLLMDVVRYGVAFPLRAVYGFDRPVAGKTGTTDDYRDAWFLGFTPYLVAGVWIGYDRPRSLGSSAVHIALPVWATIMKRLVGDFPPTAFASDADIEYRYIDPWSGYLADGGGCPAMLVPFLPGTAPTLPCSAAPDSFYYWGLDSAYMADTGTVLKPDTAYFEPPPQDTLVETEPDTTSESEP